MDTPPQVASNNVTVEYTDPSSLFPAVRPILETKLPLRNLHWNSPTRPVRSIDSLRIGFVPAHEETAARASTSRDGTAPPAPRRRHQIPGLRQTPYLKIYFLRCDDNDTYKTSARKAVREWIKSQASTPGGASSSSNAAASGSSGGGGGGSGGGSSQEKHDAFEWLIVHVVPDADAAEKPAAQSKWPSLSTSSVLEKIKADFNGTSKSAVDRVAQIRLPKAATGGGGDAEKLLKSSSELAEQVEDVVEKMKNGILASFDLRVAQYEEDIKEKDSQRSLPGWNFCTFFILKEGLARGFESVGLFEDALVGYDELSVGLDIAVREQLEGTGDRHGGTFLMHSTDWNDTATKALEAAEKGDAAQGEDGDVPSIPELSSEQFPLTASKKPYRDMILASNISIFDFRTYIFSRQLTLLLRAARMPSMTGETEKQQKQGKKGKEENLVLLSEVCERSTEFIGIAARTLRFDLECGLLDVDDTGKTVIIDNLITSWTYAATSQILSQTSTPALRLADSSLRAVGKKADASGTASAVAETRDVPKRTSSLPSMLATRPTRPASQEMLPPDALAPVQARPGQDTKSAPVTQKTGSEQLASGRGQLLSLARRVLEDSAGRCGWKEKWNDLDLLFDEKREDLAEVSLEDEDDSKDVQEPREIGPLSGIELPLLKTALKSQKTFRSQYELLTDQVFRHYITANRTHSAEVAIADIAILRYRQADYEAAAAYFHQVIPLYGSKRWTILEGVMLEMYARCLKELKRNEEYVRAMLRLLAKYATYTQSGLSIRQKTLDASNIFTETALVDRYVEDLFDTVGGLQKEVSASLLEFFGDLDVDPAILHYDDRDGFQVQLWLRFLLGKKIDVDSIKIRLVYAGKSHSSEHWIEASTKVAVKSSPTRILIDASTTLQGKYFVDRIELRSGNIVFTLGGGKKSALPVGFREEEAENEDGRPYVYCYPPPEGLQARVVAPHYVNLEEMRTLEVELDSGRNDIIKGTIRVRPATAGLRLRIAETKVVEGEISITSSNESGSIEFSQLGPQSSIRFRIPYTVEENHALLFARTEVRYETADGSQFSYSSGHGVVSTLPISVNVQDIFKDEVLFSRFTIAPAMLIPLRILECSVPTADGYDVESSIRGRVALNVFPKQPASLVYKIRRQEPEHAKRALRLKVEFTCMDDECLHAVEETFRMAVMASEFRRFTALLTSHVTEVFRRQLSASEMEVIGLVREIETLSYQSARWEGLLSTLKGSTEGLRAWLQEWHKTNYTIKLPSVPSVPSRHIIIPVDIPEIQVVHTAELRLSKLAEQPIHAAVGQLIPAELLLRNTRRWCARENRENEGGALEFSYEIHANPEQWLVGGRKRGNFTAADGETKSFAVLLLPQKPGYLLLPGVEVKSYVRPNASTITDGTPVQRKPLPSEVDYRNHGATVLVLPDLRKTTVSLGPGTGTASAGHGAGPGSGAWLVDSERRVEEGVYIV